MKRDVLRRIPQVEKVLQTAEARRATEQGAVPRTALTEAVRGVLEEVRRGLVEGEAVEVDPETLATRAVALAESALASRLVRVVNATGVVLHTNLGRAPLSREALEAMQRVSGYCNLEYDLSSGHRGHRHDAVSPLLRELTGAEAALVVNNNAAAVLLAVTALARGREVIVSRGELVEIGGSFRIPEVMAQSGARLREVGTTNKTHLGDYEAALGPETALLLKVHTSNYRVLGFTASVSVSQLAQLGRGRGIPVMEDLGSGCLIDLSAFGLEREPTVSEAVAAGADVVTFSGDKLLGGPQAGILVGRRESVEACSRHPLMRAVRPDKTTLAALEATLRLYRDPVRCLSAVPALARLVVSAEALRGQAERLAAVIRAALGDGETVHVIEGFSEVGGGALPLQRLPTWLAEVRSRGGGVSQIEAELRQGSPPVICRIREDALLFDPRTLEEGEENLVAAALAAAFEREKRQ